MTKSRAKCKSNIRYKENYILYDATTEEENTCMRESFYYVIVLLFYYSCRT